MPQNSVPSAAPRDRKASCGAAQSQMRLPWENRLSLVNLRLMLAPMGFRRHDNAGLMLQVFNAVGGSLDARKAASAKATADTAAQSSSTRSNMSYPPPNCQIIAAANGDRACAA